MKVCLALALCLASPAVAQETRVSLHITFDTATTTALQERGEMVVVDSWYYGDPATGNVLPLDEMGMLYLGGEQATIWPVDQTVQVGGSLGGAPLGNVVAPMLNVNVYSARHSSPDNLLDCTLIEGPSDDLSKTPQDIACTLLK